MTPIYPQFTQRTSMYQLFVVSILRTDEVLKSGWKGVEVVLDLSFQDL